MKGIFYSRLVSLIKVNKIFLADNLSDNDYNLFISSLKYEYFDEGTNINDTIIESIEKIFIILSGNITINYFKIETNNKDIIKKEEYK